MPQQQTLLIESQYLPPIHYFARMLHHKEVLIEQEEHFEKASYRNRAHIASPNGPLRLSVPLSQGRSQRRPFRKVGISYDHAWQKQHWWSIKNAYQSSPYFEYYEDDIEPLIVSPAETLLELNNRITQTIIELLQLPINIRFTQSFQKKYDDSVLDFRSKIHPIAHRTTPDPAYSSPTYEQVFDAKTGFQADLSILDLLLNMGPRSVALLEGAISTL